MLLGEGQSPKRLHRVRILALVLIAVHCDKLTHHNLDYINTDEIGSPSQILKGRPSKS